MSQVSLRKCNTYEPARVKETIRKSLDDIGGIARFVKPGQRVMLKPNLFSEIAVGTNAATHPSVIRAVAELVIEQGAYVSIGESVCGDRGNRQALKKHAGSFARNIPLKLSDFQGGHFTKVDIKDAHILDHVVYANNFLNADVRINLPKFKTHMATCITGAVKNSFGCIAHSQRMELHRKYQKEDFSKAVLDIFANSHFDLTIMDSIECLEGNDGPAHGPVARLGYIVTSQDAVAVDSVVSKVAGMEPRFIPTCHLAGLRDLGSYDISKMSLKGDPLTNKHFASNIMYDYFKRLYESGSTLDKTVRVILKDRCIDCLACKNNCPVYAIDYGEDGKLSIDRDLCVRCDCCVEICPVNAVKVVTKD